MRRLPRSRVRMGEHFGHEVDEILNLIVTMIARKGSIRQGLPSAWPPRYAAPIASLPHNSSGLPPSTMRPVSRT